MNRRRDRRKEQRNGVSEVMHRERHLKDLQCNCGFLGQTPLVFHILPLFPWQSVDLFLSLFSGPFQQLLWEVDDLVEFENISSFFMVAEWFLSYCFPPTLSLEFCQSFREKQFCKVLFALKTYGIFVWHMILRSLHQIRKKIFLFLMIYLLLTLQHISYTWVNSVSTNYLIDFFSYNVACISFYFNHLAVMVTFTIEMGGLQACTAKSVDELIHISGFLEASNWSPSCWHTRCEVHHQPTLICLLPWLMSPSTFHALIELLDRTLPTSSEIYFPDSLFQLADYFFYFLNLCC